MRGALRAPQAIEACDFFVARLREAILGAGRDEVLGSRAWSGHPDIVAIAGGSWRTKNRAVISSSGYVVHTLEAALWSVANTNSFEEALILAVNLADDSDTVGAVTGQLAGALYGASAIPERWLAPLAWREKIEALSLALLKAVPKSANGGVQSMTNDDGYGYKPWLVVKDCAYFQGVLGSLVAFAPNGLARRDSTVTVRFGLQGQGIYPNYQIERPGRVPAAHLGIGHGLHPIMPTGYEEAHLSQERFTLQDVQALLTRCQERNNQAMLTPKPARATMQTEIPVRTSETHPLCIATVEAPGGGTIGMRHRQLGCRPACEMRLSRVGGRDDDIYLSELCRLPLPG